MGVVGVVVGDVVKLLGVDVSRTRAVPFVDSRWLLAQFMHVPPTTMVGNEHNQEMNFR